MRSFPRFLWDLVGRGGNINRLEGVLTLCNFVDGEERFSALPLALRLIP